MYVHAVAAALLGLRCHLSRALTAGASASGRMVRDTGEFWQPGVPDFQAQPESELLSEPESAICHPGQGALLTACCSLLACLWGWEDHYLANLPDKASLHVDLVEGEVMPYLGVDIQSQGGQGHRTEASAMVSTLLRY